MVQHNIKVITGMSEAISVQSWLANLMLEIRRTTPLHTDRTAILLTNQNQFHQNQQHAPFSSHHPSPNHQSPPYRGHPPRGGTHQQYPSDRRASGPAQSGPPRGRGGHYTNLQWTPNSRRGGPQGQSHHSSHTNSSHPSPVPVQHAPKDTIDPPVEEDNPFRPSKDLQMEDDFRETRPTPAPRQTSTEGKESRISFAIKSKSQQSLSKAPSDLVSKSKGPQRPTNESKDRLPSHQPRSERYDDQKSQKPQHRRAEDSKRPHRDAPNPKDRTADHSDYPPSKKQKHEAKPKLTLLPEFASSDSIYYRKPGHESVVGAGTYGRVYKAIHIYTKAKVALKKIKMEGERDGFPITATREIRLLQHLRHKNVVALQEVMVEKNECFMVFEYLSHDLTGLINHPTFKLTPAHKKDLARQMFDGLEFLHRRGVLHRDIKAANILISNNGQLKYADFGLARFYSKSRQLDYTNRVITIWYRPPELLLGETQYGPAVDIWSAACVFVEMFTKKAIFPGEGSELNQLEKVYNVLGTPTRSDWPSIVELPWFELIQPNIDRKKRTFESLFKDILSPATLDLVRAMLRYDPTKRPSAEEVLAHPYFVEEEPKPQQAIELAETEGDWHEYESKGLSQGEGAQGERPPTGRSGWTGDATSTISDPTRRRRSPTSRTRKSKAVILLDRQYASHTDQSHRQHPLRSRPTVPHDHIRYQGRQQLSPRRRDKTNATTQLHLH